MILEQSYTLEHIESIRESKIVDKAIIERSIYALGLLEALARVGLSFIFKGGTSMLLLLESPMRLSTDIDIIVKPGTDIKHYLEAASKIIPFKRQEEQVRKSSTNIEKRHYKFVYDSPASGKEFYILLDILFEDNHYAKTVDKPIKNPLVVTEEPYVNVTIPTADCLMGDKMTAFAPHTTGIPFGVNKELEIIKQMYDISCLFAVMTDSNDVYDSYMATVKSEIAYRGENITFEDALQDTIDTAVCIASKGMIGDDYELLLKGIRALKTHVYDGKFTAESAVGMACKVMYAAACLLKNEEIRKLEANDEIIAEQIAIPKYSKLTKLRKYEPEGYVYVLEAVKLLSEGD